MPPTAIHDPMETQEQQDIGSHMDTQNSQIMPQIGPGKVNFKQAVVNWNVDILSRGEMSPSVTAGMDYHEGKSDRRSQN